MRFLIKKKKKTQQTQKLKISFYVTVVWAVFIYLFLNGTMIGDKRGLKIS